MITPRQIALVRSSFALLEPRSTAVATQFYDNLFRADPSIRELFKSNLHEQGARLMQMIGTAVGLLDRPHALMPALHNLGKRHAGYGVSNAHYATVGTALLETLAAGLGEAFDAQTRAAWSAMYALVSQAMLDAQDAPAACRPEPSAP